MDKVFFGMMAGVTLTLTAIHVLQAEKPPSQNKLSQAQTRTTANLEGAVVDIASELALLQAAVDGLNAKIDDYVAAARSEPDNLAQAGPVAGSVNMTGEHDDSNVDPQVLASQKQDVLNRLVDPGITLPDFVASAELAELPSEAQDEVMQEFVRRFNSGEIDRQQFVPGYKY